MKIGLRVRAGLILMNSAMALSLATVSPAAAEESCSPTPICGIAGGCNPTRAQQICAALTPAGCQLTASQCIVCPSGDAGFYCTWQ